MARTRLRDARSSSDEQAYYARVYPQGYRHDRWPDHVERVAESVDLLRRWQDLFQTAADLSCGDGAILRRLDLSRAYLGDMNAAPQSSTFTGDHTVKVLEPGVLPGSLHQLPERVDLYVCSETLEHMDDPDELLREIKLCARHLFLSTPVEESLQSGNLEHYWSWSTADISQMLQDAGWTPMELLVLKPLSTVHLTDAYTYQLWLAEAS